MTAHAQSHAPIIVTRVDGQRANPVLFDRALFQDLKSLEGDVGGRALFDRFKLVYVPWEDPQIKFDVDTPEDYQRLLDRNIDG
jgi:molybdenum cofactor cytidylyltransferase